jgi:iron complex outermembrane recepter protein
MSNRSYVWAIAIASVLTVQSVEAKENVITEIPQVGGLDTPATTVKDWLSQTPALTQIREVRVNPTTAGVEVVLETTTGRITAPAPKTQGRILYFDIPNAALTLGENKEFRAENPVKGIASIVVTQVSPTYVRVQIVGTEGVPTASVATNAHGLVITPAPSAIPVAEAQEADEEEITVTGSRSGVYRVPNASVTRTNTPILDTPGSVQVIPREVFQGQGAGKFSDAFRSVAGASTGNTSRQFFNNVQIRGFDISSVYLRNGIPEISNSSQLPKDLSNVERLEVLSGPASVVGGQISPGGIVNIVTKQPLSSPLYELSASYGSFNTVEGGLDFSGPLNDSKTLAYRLNTSVFRSDTVFGVDQVDSYRLAISPVISWQINDKTKLTFEGQYLDSRFPQRTGIPARGSVLDNPNGKIPDNQFLGEPTFDGDNRQVLQVGYDLEHRLNDNWSLRHAFRYSNLKREQSEAFITALQDDLRTLERVAENSSDNINNYLATAYVTGTFKTGGIKHQLLAGIDYVYEESFNMIKNFEINGNLDLFNPIYTGIGSEILADRTEEQSTRDGLGIYVQDQLKMFNDRLILVLGGRVDFAGSSFTDISGGTPKESQRNTAFSPRVGILYKVTDDVSVYGSFSQSFQQEVGRSVNDEVFQPSRGTQYEVGVKADWLDKRFSTTLAFYDLTKINVLTSDPNNPDFSIQTGEQRSRGIEFAATGEILPGWNVIATYAYTDAKITKDNDFAGSRLIYIPDHSANLWTTYTVPKGSLRGLGFGFGLSYIGERAGDLGDSFNIPGYVRADAALYYRRGNLSLALNLQNLFDTNYIEASDDILRVYPGDPLTVKLSVKYQF